MPVGLPDTSCLSHPERIDRLDLLRALYKDVRIPPAVQPLLDALQGSGFWMSDALYEHALRRAGEH